ncbi:MAG: type II toxin-antitoxin system RelE family toxin [Thermoplasmatota archaeon]
MYDLHIKPTADRIFRKLARNNRKQLIIINEKIGEIRENPHHEYKHLRKPLENFYRVHIDSSFVLIFSIDHAEEKVTVFYFGHHDDVYKWRPKKE